jgi:hypothetical protein
VVLDPLYRLAVFPYDRGTVDRTNIYPTLYIKHPDGSVLQSPIIAMLATFVRSLHSSLFVLASLIRCYEMEYCEHIDFALAAEA